MNKIGLFEVWLGKIPDYFNYHLETIRYLPNVDFHFFTNDSDFDFSKISYKNFHLYILSEEDFIKRFNQISQVKINEIKNPKKIIDFKLSYFDMFDSISKKYEHVGIYDIDTLFGDIDKHLVEYQKEYDFISVGDEVYHNRLSGPLLIIKNTKEIRELLRTERYYETLLNDEIYGYGEQELSEIALSKYRTKIIYSMNTEIHNGGKTSFDVHWNGGRLNVNGKEKLIYHFYKKNKTIFKKIGNQIFGRYDKKFLEDFYWVFGFTENYSETVPYLMDSMQKYSNRKCIIYTINFDYEIPKKFLTSEQFILRRINIEPGNKDYKNRDENIISCKPKLMIDVIGFLPDKKFIFIDSDVSLTVSADDISKHFVRLKNYPLINSHTHDRVYLLGIDSGEFWTDTIDILSKKTGIEICVFPRRKTNIMLFDVNSKWFFEEQIEVYEKYKNTEIGIFALHDEDSANLILSKYQLYDCLHLCDMEEATNIDLTKYTDPNHPFNQTHLSPYLVLPKHPNEVAIFHGFKETKKLDLINNDYGNSVLDCEEIIVTYSDNTILFEKNSFLSSKKISNNVNFIIKDTDGNLIQKLSNQKIFDYWLFYISNVFFDKKNYIIEIENAENGFKIYNNLLKIN